MKLRMNAKLIESPVAAREVLMSVTAALYTSMNRNTPMNEAAEIAGICASMWQVCDALSELAGGEGKG
ncbi:MAG: hypothetical protein IJP86_05325 [Synergistaceae bacterium]|nr:hypothetical protein [Synergistaceae bacterium]